MNQESGEIIVSAEGGVRVVTLNRPDALNATNAALHRRLSEIWQELSEDRDAAVVVLTGAGRAFSAGGDFEFMQALQSDGAAREMIMREARRILVDMIRFPLPMVAAVNGPAMGLGCSLALSCDVVLLSDKAVMADPHVNVGLVAGDGGAALWPLYTSLLKAKEYLFTGETISAEEAVRLGLANRVVEHPVLMDEALKLADMLASRPQQALRDTKRALNMHIEQAAFGPFEMAIQAEIKSMASAEHAAFVAGAAHRAKQKS